jgi:ribosomal protein S18 acetylase RimI-like enzyme
LEYRPILPNFEVFTTSREDLYFKARPELIAPYRQFADTVSAEADGPRQVIGIVQGYDDWEYPLWVLAGAPWQSKIVHLGVLPSGERIGFESQLATVDILFDSLSIGQPTTTRMD